MEEQKEMLEVQKTEYSPTTIYLDENASDILNELKKKFEEKHKRIFSWSDIIRELKDRSKK